MHQIFDGFAFFCLFVPFEYPLSRGRDPYFSVTQFRNMHDVRVYLFPFSDKRNLMERIAMWIILK